MGLLTPLYLFWLFGSLAALVLIYLRARARMTVEVSSLMLFEELSAPVVRHRFLRPDALFWLEAAALSALSLALAGLYLRLPARPQSHRIHALVFNLGAAAGARDGSHVRLDEMRSVALAIVAHAPPGERFSVVGYAIRPTMIHAASADRGAIRGALGRMKADAVAVHRAALRAALIRVRDAGAIDLFTDRPVNKAVIASSPAPVNVHLVGAPADNLAIVALDPGVPGISPGHCVIQSFAAHPISCFLTIGSDRGETLRLPLVVEPESEAVVPFGPLTQGGLIHAHLAASADALAADNDRFAYVAPGDVRSKALVLSPDASARDDLSRILLGVDQNLTVTALDPTNASASVAGVSSAYKIAVMHDCYVPGVKAQAQLLIFPPAPGEAGLRVASAVNRVRMRYSGGAGLISEPLVLPHVRMVALPIGMNVTARSLDDSGRTVLPIAAFGHDQAGRIGILAFDIRNHFLLNPDDLEALLLTVDMVKRLLAPANLRIVRTGNWISVNEAKGARLIAPDGAETVLDANPAGQISFRALQAGHYRLMTPGRELSVYANYFNENESNLNGAPAAFRSVTPVHYQRALTPAATRARPLSPILILVAILALAAESILLLRDVWPHWRSRSNV
ncbi:MAG: BatA domain-containing protein [Candidatus Binataceae bacterium]